MLIFFPNLIKVAPQLLELDCTNLFPKKEAEKMCWISSPRSSPEPKADQKFGFTLILKSS